MRCEESQEAISSFLDNELDDTTSAEMLHHLGDCNDCRTVMLESRAMHRRMRGVSWPEVPERLDARILTSLQERSAKTTNKTWLGSLLVRRVSLRLSFVATLLVVLLTGWILAILTLISGPPSGAGMPPQILTLPAVEAHGLHVSNENDNKQEG